MRTRVKPTKTTLIKRYHTIAKKNGMTDEDKASFLEGWGVLSSTELTDEQLERACQILARQSFMTEESKMRKRVMAAIGEYLSLTGRDKTAQNGSDYIKSVACRAAGCEKFNSIPLDKLRAVYTSFTHHNKVFKATGNIVNDDLTKLSTKN